MKAKAENKKTLYSIGEAGNKESYQGMEDGFRKKILELLKAEQEIHNSYLAVNDWYEMLNEAKSVSAQKNLPVSIRYQPTQEYAYLDQEFSYNYRDSIINIPWTDYLESMNCSVTGPVMMQFPSSKDKINGSCNKVKIMQKIVGHCDKRTNRFIMDGQMVASVYHIGSHDSLAQGYQKILDYTKEKGYVCEENPVERYVVDYWASEIMDELPTKRVVAGMVICVSGAIIINWVTPEGSTNFTLGIICALVAAICWGLEGMFSSSSGEELDPEISVNLRELISGVVDLVIIVPAVGALSLLAGTFKSGVPVIWLLVAGLAAAVSFLTWYKSNALVGCAIGMSLNVTYAFWGVIFCVIFLGQELTVTIVTGSIVIVLGAVLVTMNPLDLFRKK